MTFSICSDKNNFGGQEGYGAPRKGKVKREN
jgi:hypothetical protein